jgi:hypothetical protein
MIVVLLPLLLGCVETEIIPKHFDGPVAAAVIPEGEGPFGIATGYVANSRSGLVTPLDLKTGRLLTDDPTASFLRASPIAFGRTRILTDVAAVATDTSVDVWTIDNASGMVLRAPYVASVDDDGNPREVEPTATVPAFVDADGSGDTATISDVEVRPGLTTTEDWSIEYDGTRWWAKGSWSGKQGREPVAGTLYWSDFREVQFTIDGTATVGDRFDFHTETGVRTFDLGARATALLVADGLLYVSVTDGTVHVLDAHTAQSLGTVALEAGAQPGRMVLDDAGTLYLADAALPEVHRLSGDPATLVDTPLPVAGPVVDVAWSAGEGIDGTPFARLFVAPLAVGRVDIYDTLTDTWVDPNPVTPEVEGISLDAPILGMAASQGDVRQQIPTVFGAWPEIPSIAVATGEGTVYQIDASTGCYIAGGEGPKGPNALTDGSDEQVTFTDVGVPSTPAFWTDAETGVSVVASPCGGVTRSEDWTLTYDGAALNWTVEGSVSGFQANRAWDDERYVSDTGAISFLIASGTLPPSNGDTYTFATDGNLLAIASTDVGRDTKVEATWEFPGRPATYVIEGGPTGGGWDDVAPHQYALLPVTNTDITARVSLDEGWSDVFWQ